MTDTPQIPSTSDTPASRTPAADTPPGESPALRMLPGGRSDEAPAQATAPQQPAARLVELIAEHWHIAVDAATGQVCAIDDRQVVRPLDDRADEIAAAYWCDFGAVISPAVIRAATMTVAGLVAGTPAMSLVRRYGSDGDAVLVDLGDATGQVVRIDCHGWRLLDRSPMPLRRSALMLALPAPERGGTIEDLRAAFGPVGDDDWPLVLGWLVAATMADIPRPLLLVTGEQGTAKSTVARRVVDLLDPSQAPLRPPGGTARDWAATCMASALIAIDNASHISTEESDRWCRAVTGDSWAARRLRTDSAVIAASFRRALVVTGIAPGPLRGDLADRCVPIELQPIDPATRLPETQLAAEFAAARPRLLGVIYDMVADVLDVLPHLEVFELPRMADYGRILAALDHMWGWHSLARYRQRLTAIATEVTDADPVALAVAEFVASRRPAVWEGTAGELLAALNAWRPSYERPPRGWPQTPSVLSRRLRQAAPALRAQGIDIDTPEPTGHDRRRILRLAVATASAEMPSAPPAPHQADGADSADCRSAAADELWLDLDVGSES